MNKHADGSEKTNKELTRYAKGIGNMGGLGAVTKNSDDHGGPDMNRDHPETPMRLGKGKGATPVTIKIAKGGR